MAINKEQGKKQTSLPDRYNPQDVEQRIYSWWEESGYFKSEDTSTKPPYSIILPPPNVTGSLHLGPCSRSYHSRCFDSLEENVGL